MFNDMLMTCLTVFICFPAAFSNVSCSNNSFEMKPLNYSATSVHAVPSQEGHYLSLVIISHLCWGVWGA